MSTAIATQTVVDSPVTMVPCLPEQALLLEAADLVEVGWTKRTYTEAMADGSLRFCALGALSMARYGKLGARGRNPRDPYFRAVHRLALHLVDTVPEVMPSSHNSAEGTVMAYNDRLCTGAAQMAEHMRRAAL